jgi:hypothetical protein
MTKFYKVDQAKLPLKGRKHRNCFPFKGKVGLGMGLVSGCDYPMALGHPALTLLLKGRELLRELIQ